MVPARSCATLQTRTFAACNRWNPVRVNCGPSRFSRNRSMDRQTKPCSIMAEEDYSYMQTPCALGSGMALQPGSLTFQPWGSSLNLLWALVQCNAKQPATCLLACFISRNGSGSRKDRNALKFRAPANWYAFPKRCSGRILFNVLGLWTYSAYWYFGFLEFLGFRVSLVRLKR